MMNRQPPMRRTLGVIGVAATLLGVTAAPAQATPLGYLQALNRIGLVVYDANQAVRYGEAICNELNYATGDVVAADVYTSTTWADVPNVAVAAAMVFAAVENLCPWHDHRGQAL